MKIAHIITDMTNGFGPECPTELPVAETLDGKLNVIPAINAVSAAVRALGPIKGINIFSRDWHEKGNIGLASTYPDREPFSVNAASWPDHSMANTFGAEFFGDMKVECTDAVVYKGFAHDHPFSPFAGSTMRPSKRGWVKGPEGVLWVPDRSVHNILDEFESDAHIVDGVAGEYCVDAGMVDSVNTGVKTLLILMA